MLSYKLFRYFVPNSLAGLPTRNYLESRLLPFHPSEVGIRIVAYNRPVSSIPQTADKVIQRCILSAVETQLLVINKR